MTKVCRVCSEEKSLDEYYEKKTTRDGLTTQCKTCHNRIARGLLGDDVKRLRAAADYLEKN